MRDSQQPILSRSGIALLWIAFGGIVVIYLFGLATEAVVPFGPQCSLVSVIQRVSISDMSRPISSGSLHALVLAGGVALLLGYTFGHSRRQRLVAALTAILAPLPLFTRGDVIKGLCQWVLSAPFAPFLTVAAILGIEDGEFYAEGFPVYVAAGWWMVLWCLLSIRELWFSKQDDHPGCPVAESEH
jgi:hypothetical protein